jgi:hypothetical protein
MFGLAALFPLLLWLVGALAFGIARQSSLSDYYVASPGRGPVRLSDAHLFRRYALRDRSIPVPLQGVHRRGERGAERGGHLGVLVAIFPTDQDGAAGGIMARLSIHGASAILLFNPLYRPQAPFPAPGA